METREVRNDEDTLLTVKSILRKKFDKILIAYKYMASQLGTSVPQIGENTLLEFVNNCPNILNSKYVSNDILIQATTIKGYDISERNKGKNINVPNNIIRHQFLYLLVKISTSNYVLMNNCIYT